MKTRRYDLTSAVAALILFFGVVAATPASAQDGGNAGFNATAQVDHSGTILLGASGGADGVVQKGAFMVGGTAFFDVTVTTPDNITGTLHVWIDENGDVTDPNGFVDNDANQLSISVPENDGAALTVHVAVPLNSTTAGSRWFRFIFEEGSADVIDPNTDYTTGQPTVVDGEIEDYQLTVIDAGNPVSFATTAGGVTTTIDVDSGNLRVHDGTNFIFTAPFSDITGLTINGDAGGDDTFQVSLMGATDPIPSGGITVNGGVGGQDELTIIASTNNTTVTHNFATSSDGSVVVDAGTISYTGLEPITDNVPAVSRVFNFTGGADSIVMTEAGGVNDDVIEIDSNNSEKVTFDVSATTSITINADAGADDVTIEALDGIFTGATITVNGEDDADILTLDMASNGPLSSGNVVFNGGASTTDALVVTNGSFTTVTVDYDAGTVDVGLATDITFATTESVDIDLTVQDYVFDLTGGADSVLLGDDAGAGDGESRFSDGAIPVIFNNPTGGSPSTITVNAGAGADDITVAVLDSNVSGTTVTVNGGDDADVLNLDLASDGPLGTADLVFNGGNSLSDLLKVENNSYTGVTVDFDAGTVEMGLAQNITFATTEDIDIDLTVEDYIFDLTGLADIGFLKDDDGASDGESLFQLFVVPTIEVVFNNPAGVTPSITINGLAGDDNIAVETVDGNALNDTFVNGGADDDNLTLGFSNGGVLEPGDVTYDGGTGTNQWTLTEGASTTYTSVTHHLEAYSVDVDAATGKFYYSNALAGYDNLLSNDKTFDLTLGSDTASFTDDGGANDGISRVTDGTQTIDFQGPEDDLDIYGWGGDDEVTLERIDIDYNGTITFYGGDDDDTFVVDWVNGSPIANPTVTYSGDGGGTNQDMLVLNDGAGINVINHFFDNANDGTVTVDGSTMTYTGLEPIDDNLTAATRNFTFDTTDDEIFLDADFAASDSRIYSTSSSETTTFSFTGLDTVNIFGGDGSDSFDVEPSSEYEINVDGGNPATLTPGDQFTLNVGSLPSTEKITLEESSNTAGVYSFSKQTPPGGTSIFQNVSYTAIELVTLRFSDPNAFSASSYKGDWTYPLASESGISIEPYFNWDIELNQNLDLAHPSRYQNLQLDVSQKSDLSDPVFRTTTKEDGTTPFVDLTGPIPLNSDHYIMDMDRVNPTDQFNTNDVLLKNNTKYYWGLTATMAGNQQFCQVSSFTTVNNLKPTLDYPSEDLTIYDLDFKFDWNVASPAQPDVYWRMELDNTTGSAFVGDVPETAQGLLMGEGENDDDTTVADGFAANTEFESTDLPTPLVWGTNYAWRISTMWPAPPTGWVPQEIFDKNETDRLVSLSAVGEFKTVTKALVPNLTYPVGGMNIYANDPVLSWNVAAPFAALTFELEIRSGSNAGPLVCSSPITGISGLAYNTSNCAVPLVPGTTYFWKVRSNDGNVNSAWSGWQSFTVLGNGVASAAFPSYPVNGLEIYTTSPEFHWFMAKDPTGLTWVAHYLERISPNPAPASCAALKVAPGAVVAPAAGNVNVTHVDVSGLKPGATYDWCVTTTGANGSVESGLASFLVAGGTVDGAPTATWPIGNPTTYTLDQELHWSVTGAQLGISGYTVEYCVNGPFGSGGPTCTTVSAITQRQYEITGLDYGDVVVWRVKASYINGAADSAWSNGGFTVTGALNTLSAVLTYPVNGLVIYDDQAQISWYVNGATLPQGTLTFQVQWSYAESFPPQGTVTQTATTTNPYYDVTNLIPGHTYWWRVRISLDGGSNYGGWSTPVGRFDVQPGASAVMPRVGSPAQSVVIATNSPTLSWILPTQSTSTLVYEVLIGQREDLADAVVFTDIPQTSLRVSDLSSGQYFWAVRSLSSNGTTSALSSVGTFYANGSFSTGVEVEDHAGDNNGGSDNNGDTSDNAGGDVDDNTGDDVSRDQDATDDGNQSIEDPSEEVLPDNWALGQNYPNPFNPTTTIEFSMLQAAGVTVRVYNVLGQVVKTLVNGTLPPGIHRVQWDATDDTGAGVTSGLYIYRMETEAFQATKTLVLMK